MNKPPKKPFSQRICEKFDIPVGTFGRISFIEATGNRELAVGGCEGLLTYTDTKVVLVLCDSILTINGNELEIRSFCGGRVLVEGIIASIEYGDDGNG